MTQVRCDTQALGGRAQFRLAGEKQVIVEKLRTMAQHKLAVYARGLPGDAAQEIVNAFLRHKGRYVFFAIEIPNLKFVIRRRK